MQRQAFLHRATLRPYHSCHAVPTNALALFCMQTLVVLSLPILTHTSPSLPPPPPPTLGRSYSEACNRL